MIHYVTYVAMAFLMHISLGWASFSADPEDIQKSKTAFLISGYDLNEMKASKKGAMTLCLGLT